jgi:hypothetical protein
MTIINKGSLGNIQMGDASARREDVWAMVFDHASLLAETDKFSARFNDRRYNLH